MTENKLTHFDAAGNAVMVDVSGKPVTAREAVALGVITMNEAAFAALAGGTVQKGDVLGVARVAGIMATKHTSDLIPPVPSAAPDQSRAGLPPAAGAPGRGGPLHGQDQRGHRGWRWRL